MQSRIGRIRRCPTTHARQLFRRLGFSPAEATRRALLGYTAYLRFAQFAHATPQVLPQTQAAKRAYLNDVSPP